MQIGFINYLNDTYELNYFIEIISMLDTKILKNLNLQVYTVVLPVEKISEIQDKVGNIEIKDRIEDFDFSRVELGIVPSLIKETISESTIYFLNHDIPILSGSNGGDSCLCDSDMFVYYSEEDFKVKFMQLTSKPELLKEYKRNYNACTSKFLEELNEEAKNCK